MQGGSEATEDSKEAFSASTCEVSSSGFQLRDSLTDLGFCYKFKEKFDLLALLYRDQHHLLMYLTPGMANDSQAAPLQNLWLLVKIKSHGIVQKAEVSK